MSEKLKANTDPSCRTYTGVDRIYWVPMAASQVFARRGGKAVDLHHRYQAATASSSNLAGFIETDAAGIATGHPASTSDGDLLPVNFGNSKSCVFPTTGRAATAADVGKRFDIAVVSSAQFVNMSASSKGILQIEKVLDNGGAWVAASIPADKRYGTL